MNPEDTKTVEPEEEEDPTASETSEDNRLAGRLPQGNAGSEPSLELRVNRAASKDVGRGIIRMDPSDMERIGCQIGDIVGIRGHRRTVARVLPTYTFDRGKSYAFIDGLLRENAQVGLGETIAVYKVRALPAIEIRLAALTARGSGYNCQQINQALEGLPAVTGDRLRANYVGAAAFDFKVLDASPDGAVLFHPSTALRIELPESSPSRAPAKVRITYEDVGGLGQQIARIREMIELPLKYPQVFERLGIEPPKGVLMYGAPGSGKTLIARVVASETDAHFIKLNGPEIIHKFYGESEARLRSIFEEASRRAPAIIFIDEIDAIAPKRTEVLGDVEKRVVAQLLGLMDGLQSRGQVIVIAATNIPDAIDPALRRPGRFDREIMIPAPDKDGRLEILQIHTRSMPLSGDVSLNQLAAVTHGFVGADLASLCREAAMNSVRTLIPSLTSESDDLPPDSFVNLEVSREHFQEALRQVEPSAIRDILVDTPDVGWESIGGLESIKQVLKESIDWPLKYPHLFAQAKVKPPKGILLCGPPGTGKTTLAKALARECQANFISIKGPALFSKWVGETEKGVRELFRKARQVAPTIIFIDEIDSLAAIRGTSTGDSGVADRVISQLLTEMDGLEELKGVVVVAATNRREAIDPALLRPGRFDFILSLPVPDQAERLKILEIHTAGRPLADDVDLYRLSEELHDCVGADIESIVDRSGVLAIREHVASAEKGIFQIKRHHFLEALALKQTQHQGEH